MFCIYKRVRAEKADFAELYKGIQNEVLKARIRSAGNWYIERAIKCKAVFYILEIISIVLPLLISVLNSCEKSNTVVTICALSTALVTSLLTFSKCREKWTLYRTTIEQIKRELTLYWVDEPDDEKLKDLAIRIEGIMEQEHKVWIRYSKERREQKEGK